MKFDKELSKKTTANKKFQGWFIIISIVLQLMFFLLLQITNKHFPYSIDNYRYIYSSLLQIIGGIFAFIASSTLVAYQFLTSFSPISTQYYPKKWFISFLIITLTVIGIDVFSIYVLPLEININFRCIYDLLISFNIYPLAFSFKYVLFVINSITPRNQLLKILENAKKATTNKERLSVVYSLEEICLSAIQHGQGGYVRSCQDIFQEIIEIYSTSQVELNKDSAHHPDNPLRTIPDIIERITYSMIDNNMQNLVHFNGHILRELSVAKYNKSKIVDVEIAVAIEHIGTYCIEKRKITDIKNFIANSIYFIDETNSASTMLWGCKLLIKKCQHLVESYTQETLEVIEEIFTCVEYIVKNEDIPSEDSILIINFLCNQSWITEYFQKHNSKEMLTIIDSFKNISNNFSKNYHKIEVK